MIAEISIANHPDQELSVRFSDQDVRLKILFNPSANRWTMDIWIDGVLRLAGRKLLASIDIIEPYDLGIGHIYVVDTRMQKQQPERYNFPAGDVRLIWSDEPL